MALANSILEDDIRTDIETRTDSMLSLNKLIRRQSDTDKELLLLHSIPIVYSIWEGFVQTSFQTYIRELNKLGLTIDTVCEPILIYHLEAEFKQFKEYPDKNPRKIHFFNNLKQFLRSTTFAIHTPINTESNVGFNVLNGILEQFQLGQIPEYPQPRYSLPNELDKFLLNRRNRVAHGDHKSIIVTVDDLDRAITLVKMLMDLVSEKIFTGFQEKSYLRSSSSQK
jgi:hypothetical protein